MPTELLTEDAGATGLAASEGRAFLVVHIDDDDRSSRVVDLVEGIDVTFGRSRGATVTVDREAVSRLHARVRRTGEVIEVEDLASRNGTRVNGERIDAPRRLQSGDELTIGPITAVVSVMTGLRRPTAVVDADTGEARLAAEVDRALRYHRPVTIALVRTASDAAVDAIAGALRAMDLIAEDAADDYLLILPELDRGSGAVAVERVLAIGGGHATAIAAGAATCPDDGTTVEALLGHARAALRTGRQPAAAAGGAVASAGGAGIDAPVVLDPAMQRVYTLVERIGDTAMTVLILGETGVGKELVTEAIHRRSARRDQPLIKLNCAALPETLLESELFGHERGSFTGAERRKVGFFEAAHGGTLFLDEIGDMPAALQAKLLRVLERKVITRVGGTAEIPTDARLIAATHRDLDADVRAGRFRQDLLFRIGGFTLVVPPLRDRPSEILPLAERFAARAAASTGQPAPVLTVDARDALAGYTWPGNVRELKNAIERALVLCGESITAADLPDKLRDVAQRIHAAPGSSDVRGQLAEVERAAIVAALDADGGNQTRAARRLGLSRRALIYKMEKYGLKAPPSREDSGPK